MHQQTISSINVHRVEMPVVEALYKKWDSTLIVRIGAVTLFFDNQAVLDEWIRTLAVQAYKAEADLKNTVDVS